MVARRTPRFKWYVAAVTRVVRVRFTVEANYDGWRLDRYLKEKIRRLSRERVQHLIAHRLDRETSGLLACGSAPEWTKRLKRAFADGVVAKTYLALALGEPREARYTVDAPLAITGASAVRVRMHVSPGGQPSITDFEVLERRVAPDGAPVTLLACRPRTGRQHQIRAHLHHEGLPLVGDKIYGPDENIFDRFMRRALTDDDRVLLRLARQALHAWKLELPHPRTGERIQLEAPLPDDLAAFWAGCAAAGAS